MKTKLGNFNLDDHFQNQLTHIKNKQIRRVLTALAFVVSALVAASALATPPSPAPSLVTEIIANCNVGELDIFTKTDVDPSHARHFWKLKVDSKGATDLYVVRNTFQPGASTGWHTHPGPSLVTVVAGTITAYDPNCAATVYGPGAAAGACFIDIGGGEVHLLRNEGNVEAVTVAVQFIPAGFSRRIDAPNPGCAGIN
jgi:quercetin dioxygenase-like cupin family protein